MKGNKIGNLRNFYEIESIFNNLNMVSKEKERKKCEKKSRPPMSLLDWFPSLKLFFFNFYYDLVQPIWALKRKNLTLLHANNKGADQHVHLHNLISAFLILSLESITV